MNTISDYTIHCTESQTRKALELGAPILKIENAVTRNDIPHFVDRITSNKWVLYFIPTAEQMLGWLEEQKIFIHIDYDFSDNEKPYKSEMCLFNGMTNHRGWFASHKEATLAAIDAALEYLSSK